jgi:hypothetical protein
MRAVFDRGTEAHPVLIEASSQALLVAKRWSGHSNYSQKLPRQITGVHVAAYFGVEEAVAELLKAGADANAKDKNGRTPLHEASSSRVVQLLKAGAEWWPPSRPLWQRDLLTACSARRLEG